MQIHNPLGLGYLGHDWYNKKRMMEEERMEEERRRAKCSVCGGALPDRTLAHPPLHYCLGKPLPPLA